MVSELLSCQVSSIIGCVTQDSTLSLSVTFQFPLSKEGEKKTLASEACYEIRKWGKCKKLFLEAKCQPLRAKGEWD